MAEQTEGAGKPIKTTGRRTFIYALYEPNGALPRYIGKADNPVVRLGNHLKPTSVAQHTQKSCWLRGLLRGGKRPIVRIVACVCADEWQAAERRWIAHFRNVGAKLVNGTPGGDGRARGATHSPEVKLKIGLATKRHWENADYREKVANASRKVLQSSAWRARRSAESQGRSRGGRHLLGCSPFWDRPEQHRWQARIHVRGKRVSLGYFPSELDAALAYDNAARTYFGHAARTNFPDFTPDMSMPYRAAQGA